VIPTIAVGAIAIYVGMFSNIQTQQQQTPSYDSYYMPPRTEEFQHKLIVITGGTSGLGLESAKRLAAAGATIVITSRTERKGR
jgi:NADPH:quinone reductase-like Zn-dependent oxidoreductase